MPNFSEEEVWRLSLDMRYSRDYKIPNNWAHGHPWHNNEGTNYISVVTKDRMFRGKRMATLKLSNLLFSVGASHYYSRISEHGPHHLNLETNKIECIGGYLGEDFKKRLDTWCSHIDLECERRLTKLEKDLSGQKIGKKGDWTYRFNTEADSFSYGIETFKRRFGPGWILVKEDTDEGDEKYTVLAES